MSKVTKKQLQQKIDRQETRIDRLVGMLAKKGFTINSRILTSRFSMTSRHT